MAGETDNKPPSAAGELLSDMLLKDKPRRAAAGDLVVEPKTEEPVDSFIAELERSLSETEQQALAIAGARQAGQASWTKARLMVEQFQPVPWFIWRLSNYVFGKAGQLREIQEGMVLGLRRLVFAIASDPFLGSGNKVNNLKKALSLVTSDLIAAVSVIHAVCRRLANCQFERIWRPILDDALLRAQIGVLVGGNRPDFGAGWGMLAGFAGRSGLAILIGSGDLEQARRALEMLAGGADISDVGYLVYQCDPLQVSAMMLSASGCGKDAAYGTVSYTALRSAGAAANEHQACWLAAFSLVEGIRMGRGKELLNTYWESLNFTSSKARSELLEETRRLIRAGHSLNWIV